jgi:uncharacterized protein (DUF1697 family)
LVKNKHRQIFSDAVFRQKIIISGNTNRTLYMTHLALLRGINVSGHKLIKMEDLRKLLESAGFRNVQTYIQSGNVILDSTETDRDVADKIASLIADRYGFEVGILMLDREKLQAAADGNPFIKEKSADTKKTYIAFLSEKPSAENAKRLESSDFGADRWILDGNVLYLHYDHGAGTTKLSNAAIESKLKVRATSRNWNTTMKLLEMLSR